MAISTVASGITYPTRMAYYRTLEPQGTWSDAAFYVHMRLFHDPEYRKSEVIRKNKRIMKKYQSDLEFKKRMNANGTENYQLKHKKTDYKHLILPNFIFYML